MKFYEFEKLTDQKLKNISKTEYDIPQFFPDIPEGFSIFSTLKEASEIKSVLLKNNNEKKEEKIENSFEPIPHKNNYCHICQKKFDNYLEHINSFCHKNSIIKNPDIFSRIHNTFENIKNFWDEKSKTNNIIETPLKITSSLTSLPSTASISTFKIEETTSKDDSIQYNVKKSNIKKDNQIISLDKNEFKRSNMSSLCSSSNQISFLNKKRNNIHSIDTEMDNNEGYYRNLKPRNNSKLTSNQIIFFK